MKQQEKITSEKIALNMINHYLAELARLRGKTPWTCQDFIAAQKLRLLAQEARKVGLI